MQVRRKSLCIDYVRYNVSVFNRIDSLSNNRPIAINVIFSSIISTILYEYYIIYIK